MRYASLPAQCCAPVCKEGQKFGLLVPPRAAAKTATRRNVGCCDVEACVRVHACAPLHQGTRRGALLSLSALALSAAIARPPPAVALPAVRSLRSEAEALLTILNSSEQALRVYWLNYDGDQEFYAKIEPGGYFTVDTFESHPWRVVDATTGAVVNEYTAVRGEQLLRVDPLSPQPSRADVAQGSGQAAGPQEAQVPQFEGFDGIGGSTASYAPAQVQQVAVGSSGGVAVLGVDGYEVPLPIFVGPLEATSILYATGVEFRRPSTVDTFARSLEATGAHIDRVVITRHVGSTYYARIVLSLAGGGQRAVDSRPSDSLALALQSNSPIFVSKLIAEQQQAAVPTVPGKSKELRLPGEQEGLPSMDVQLAPARRRKGDDDRAFAMYALSSRVQRA